MQSVGGVWGTVFAGIGSVARVVAPVVLPTAVAIGTEWVIGKTMPAPQQQATPTALSDANAQTAAAQHETNLSTTLGIVAVAGLAVFLLARRR